MLYWRLTEVSDKLSKMTRNTKIKIQTEIIKANSNY